MKRFNRFTPRTFIGWLTIAATFLPALCVSAADSPKSPDQIQRELISVLQSEAPPQEKAITCKRLAVYGTKDAIPALAPLLANEQLSSWARIALEVIPDPAADEALRDAMGKLSGRLLVGVLNSIGVRRDLKACDGLIARLKDGNPEVAAAAAVALGHIGGRPAAQALESHLASAPANVLPAVAEGCLLCAEKFLVNKQADQAIKLYDTIRKASLPKQKLLEATRGAILARQSAGLPLLVEQLRSPDQAFFNVALHTARELPGNKVTKTLVDEIKRSGAERQAPLLYTLADRHDDAVLPAVVDAAKSGPKNLRIVALSLLERLGNESCIPLLLTAATENDADLAAAAKTTLAGLEGKNVDADLLRRLTKAEGKTRLLLIELAGQRHMAGALASVMRYAEDPNAQIRRAAVDTLGTLGEAQNTSDLVRLLQKTPAPNERRDLEKALLAVCGRGGASCVPPMLQLLGGSDSALRQIALRGLAAAGGPEALTAVNKAIQDPDEAVQDEAVGVLSTWPGSWPEDVAVAEPLLALAKSAKKTAHQVQGLRGYLQYVQENKQLKDSERLVKVNELLPFIKRPEEKQLVIAVLGSIPAPGALKKLVSYAQDASVTEEACLAIVNLAGSRSLRDTPRESRRNALQVVVEKTKNASTQKKAQDALDRLK